MQTRDLLGEDPRSIVVDDDIAENLAALAACQTFIVDTATAALDGLDASGRVDETVRTPFTLFVAIRVDVDAPPSRAEGAE